MDDTKIRVMIVEDHGLLRLGLKIILEQRNVDVIAEAENGEEAIKLAAETHPDVILMDLGMPVLDGVEAARRIRQFDKDVKIIMLTSMDNDEHIHASLSAGVNGYCLKETKPDRLLTALQTVRAGDLWLDSSIASKVLKNITSGRSDSAFNSGQHQPINALTREQLEVMHLIVEGLNVGEIAVKLDKPEQQIKDTEFAIMERLAASDRTQVALKKLRNGAEPMVAQAALNCINCGRKFDQGFKCCPFDGTLLEEIITDELTGTIFADRYEIITRLGSGGMSVVYKARHTLLGRMVAIKLLDPLLTSDLQNARRFREEALASSLLSHPNLINIIDFGLSPSGEPYLIMDYLNGQSLNDVLFQETCIGVDRAINLFIQACDGLEHAHSRGVIHRDLKPSNLMLETDPKTGRETVKIIDFGIAKVLTSHRERGQNLTQPGEILGSPTYMSPEQCLGCPMDARSDIYSLGCAMYEALCGRLPLLGKVALETMQMHVERQPESLLVRAPECRIPEVLDRIVMKALRKDQAERYQTMAEMREDLCQLLVANAN